MENNEMNLETTPEIQEASVAEQIPAPPQAYESTSARVISLQSQGTVLVILRVYCFMTGSLSVNVRMCKQYSMIAYWCQYFLLT